MAVLVNNRRAGFKYEFLEKFEAGIELLGFEVKSIKNGKANLDGAYVIIRSGEAYLINVDIAAYQPANTPSDYNNRRSRRLLLTKRELTRLAEAEQEGRLTIIPLSFYNKGRRLKISLALARGKKKYDKRETIKQRDTEREIRRTLKTEE